MKKSGLSGVITNIIIIGISLAAVGVVFFVIMHVINTSTENVMNLSSNWQDAWKESGYASWVEEESGNKIYCEDCEVGIGTTDPTAKLHILGGTNAEIGITIGTVTTDNTAKNGRIGIMPYSNEEERQLLMWGNAISDNTADAYIGGGSSVENAFTALHFYTASNATTLTGTERMTITKDGYVGIGTTWPMNKLHVHEPTASTNVYLQLTNADNGATMADGLNLMLNAAGNAAIINRENGHLSFETNNNEKMRITSTGNVGIGTTSPNAKLSVNGDMQLLNANHVACDASHRGAVKYENDNFYGCKSTGWVLLN